MHVLSWKANRNSRKEIKASFAALWPTDIVAVSGMLSLLKKYCMQD